ncbi:hypothetical protein ES703_59815 [subsurface metagenome]
MFDNTPTISVPSEEIKGMGFSGIKKLPLPSTLIAKFNSLGSKPGATTFIVYFLSSGALL